MIVCWNVRLFAFIYNNGPSIRFFSVISLVSVRQIKMSDIIVKSHRVWKQTCSHLMDLSKFNEDDTNWAEAKSWLLSLSRCKQWFAIQFPIDFRQSFISGSFWDIKRKTQQDVVSARKLLSSCQRTLRCSCVFKVQRFTVLNAPRCSTKFPNLSALCDEIVFFSGGTSQVKTEVYVGDHCM